MEGAKHKRVTVKGIMGESQVAMVLGHIRRLEWYAKGSYSNKPVLTPSQQRTFNQFIAGLQTYCARWKKKEPSKRIKTGKVKVNYGEEEDGGYGDY